MTIDPMLIAGAIVVILAAVGALVVQGFNAWAGAKERVIAATERKVLLDKVDVAAQQAVVVAEKTEVIAQKAQLTDYKLDQIQSTTKEAAKNVDGNLSKVQEQLVNQTEHSKALQKTVDMLADIIKSQQVPIQAIDRAINGTDGPTPVVESLEHIETHTEAIEKNTAKTEASVQELKDQS